MKQLLYTPIVQFSGALTTEDVVDQMEAVNNELIRRGYSVPSVSAASNPSSNAPTPKGEQGPLERKWCELKKVRGVRRTEGRTNEQQAEYNLRHYLGYTDEKIQKILDEYVPEHHNEHLPSIIEDDEEVPEHKLM